MYSACPHSSPALIVYLVVDHLLPMQERRPIAINSVPSYLSWLQDWNEHMQEAPVTVLVPLQARQICTPLVVGNWCRALQSYPFQSLSEFFLSGISCGFRIGFNKFSSTLKSARKNLRGALLHPSVVDDYLQAEVGSNRVAGPFTSLPTHNLQISRFGVIPKRNQPDKWRLIFDLSYPTSHSVNDGIPRSLCSLKYVTIDDAINQIIDTGPNTLLAKLDIKHAFRLLPIHPADRHLLAMKWRQSIYVDTCLPFGLRSAPKLFNILADLLSWISQQRGVTFVMHYLDDFLLIGPPSSPICQHNLDIFTQTCADLGVPLASEKVEGPSTQLTFLGILLDTSRMEIRLPDDKLQRIRVELASWLQKESATKREILSLVGLLQHATKVVRSGRTFVARMYQSAAKLEKLKYFTRLTQSFRSDLYWWHTFIANWNGLCILRKPNHANHVNFRVFSDASGSWGCGAQWERHWFQWQWPLEWRPIGIMAKELVPIVISCAV